MSTVKTSPKFSEFALTSMSSSFGAAGIGSGISPYVKL